MEEEPPPLAVKLPSAAAMPHKDTPERGLPELLQKGQDQGDTLRGIDDSTFFTIIFFFKLSIHLYFDHPLCGYE